MEQKFSVVICVWEKDFPAWVKQALDGIFSNTIRPCEIVIVTVGFVSKNMQIILDEAAKNPLVRVWAFPMPLVKPAAALDFAIKQCQYDLIALNGADCISLPNRFEKQLAYFSKHPQTVAVGGYGQEMDKNICLPTAMRDVPETQEEIKSLFKSCFPFRCRSVMFKKQAILDAGDCNGSVGLEEEYIWRRVLEKGYKIANLSDVIITIHSAEAYKKMILALPHFHMKKELFSTMRFMGCISSFTYYLLVCNCFIRCIFPPDWLCRMFQRKGNTRL